MGAGWGGGVDETFPKFAESFAESFANILANYMSSKFQKNLNTRVIGT